MTQGYHIPTGKADVDQGFPLRKFEGKLAELAPRFEREQQYMDLNFTDVEVHESTSPWEFPTAVLSLKATFNQRSGRLSGRSGLGHLITNLPSGVDDLNELVGKKMVLASKEVFFNEDRVNDAIEKGEEPPDEIRGRVWWVESLEGTAAKGNGSGKDDMTYLLDLANGKTNKEFTQAATTDPVGRRHIQQIVNGSFLEGAVAAGQLAKDGDKFVKVEG